MDWPSDYGCNVNTNIYTMNVDHKTKQRFEQLLSIATQSLNDAAMLLHGIPVDGQPVSSRKGRKTNSVITNKALFDYELKNKKSSK